MAMTPASMWSRIKANIATVTPVQGDSAAVQTYRDAVGQAMCQGIIDEIKNSQVVTSSGTDPQGGSVVSTSTGIV